MTKEYDINEIVWGKVSGYPWWPGFIASKVDNQEYQVIFFGDLTNAYLKPEKIETFSQKCSAGVKASQSLKYSVQ